MPYPSGIQTLLSQESEELYSCAVLHWPMTMLVGYRIDKKRYMAQSSIDRRKLLELIPQ